MEAAALVAALAKIVETLGPAGTLLAILLVTVCPAVVFGVLWYGAERRREKQQDKVLSGQADLLAALKDQQVKHERQLQDSQAELLSAMREQQLKHEQQIGTMLNRMDSMQDRHRERVDEILHKFGESLGTTTAYYNNNVDLVNQVMAVTKDLQSIVVMNSQTMQKVCDKIDMNWICPINKERIGRS